MFMEFTFVSSFFLPNRRSYIYSLWSSRNSSDHLNPVFSLCRRCSVFTKKFSLYFVPSIMSFVKNLFSLVGSLTQFVFTILLVVTTFNQAIIVHPVVCLSYMHLFCSCVRLSFLGYFSTVVGIFIHISSL